MKNTSYFLLTLLFLSSSSCVKEIIPQPQFQFYLTYTSSQGYEAVQFDPDTQIRIFSDDFPKGSFSSFSNEKVSYMLPYDGNHGLITVNQDEKVFLGEVYFDVKKEFIVYDIEPLFWKIIPFQNGIAQDTSGYGLFFSNDNTRELDLLLKKDETIDITFTLDMDASWRVDENGAVDFKPVIDLSYE